MADIQHNTMNDYNFTVNLVGNNEGLVFVDDLHPNHLPDLGNEKTLEESTFELRLKRINAEWVKRIDAYAAWLRCPDVYPDSARSNRNAFRQRASMYHFDDRTGTIMKIVKSGDGIGKYDNFISNIYFKTARTHTRTHIIPLYSRFSNNI